MHLLAKGGMDFMDLNELAKQKAMQVLQTQGISINCPNCHQQFTAHSNPAVCPNCGNSSNINFNVNN